jgi:integrase
MGYQKVGNTLAEWDDATPFLFSLKEEVGPAPTEYSATVIVDLSELRQGFTDDFLLGLKDHLIAWRNRICLSSVDCYSQLLLRLFRKVLSLDQFSEKINIIDDDFLLVLHSVKGDINPNQLNCLRNAFTVAPLARIWAPRLDVSAFPRLAPKKGTYGNQIDRILGKALTRAACIQILSCCEKAYDIGKMDISLFAFANLAFGIFCRPESYRQIRLQDLGFDTKSNSHFLYVASAKSNVHRPTKIRYLINEPLGVILQKQRQHVVEEFGHRFESQDIGKLALFPAKKMNAEKSAWTHAHANHNFGMYENAAQFAKAYAGEIRRVFLGQGLTIGANVLRHTVGTQLAQTGASARTLRGVLKHASDSVCQSYVDIAFHGLFNELSDSIQPSFDKHLPVYERFRSKNDPINPTQAIRSDDLETGQIELTGECGKRLQCEHAPITCYGCTRFIPCWDADHTVNLAIVLREIEDAKLRGKTFESSVERWTAAKYQIIMVMNAIDLHRQTLDSESIFE